MLPEYWEELLRKYPPPPAYDPSGGATIRSGPSVSAGRRDALVKDFQMERRGQGAFDVVEHAKQGDYGDAFKAFLANVAGSAAMGAVPASGLAAIVRALAMKGAKGAVSGSSTPYATPYKPSQGAVGPFRVGESSPTSTPHNAVAIRDSSSQTVYPPPPKPGPYSRYLHWDKPHPESWGASSNIASSPYIRPETSKDFVVWLLKQGLLK